MAIFASADVKTKHLSSAPEKRPKHDWSRLDSAADWSGFNQWSSAMSTLTLRFSDGADKTVAARLRAAYHSFRTALVRRHTVRSLVELDDHILKDIGLTRGDVLSLAHGLRAEKRHHDATAS
jgi:uncharacterized protein YjiS (DUF1127 family)